MAKLRLLLLLLFHIFVGGVAHALYALGHLLHKISIWAIKSGGKILKWENTIG